MIRLAVLLALGLLAGCMQERSLPRYRGPMPALSQPLAAQNLPTDLVRTELAFQRTTRDSGIATALDRFATGDAAFRGLTGGTRAGFLAAVGSAPQWSPHYVAMACDGSLGFSGGRIVAGAEVLEYASIWERRGEEYRATLYALYDVLDGTKSADVRPDFVNTEIADCEGVVELAAGGAQGRSTDGTLGWQLADGNLVVRIRQDGRDSVLFDQALTAGKR